MKKLTKLLAKEFFINLFLIALALTTAIFLFDILEFSDELLQSSANPFLFVLYRMPYYLSYIAGYAIILSSVLSVITLSYEFEMIELYCSSISSKRILAKFSVLIILASAVAFVNDGFLSPYFYRQSMILIGKEKRFEDIELKDIALKKGNKFLFIESLESGAKIFKNLVEITVDKDGRIAELTIVPEGEKKGELLVAKDGISFDRDGGEKAFSGAIDLNLSSAIITLGYKANYLTITELKSLVDAVKVYNIDVTRYTHRIALRVLHLFSPLLIFLIITPQIPIIIDDKKRVLILIKTIAFMIFYSLIETNLFRWSMANRLNPLYSFAIATSSLLLIAIASFRKKPYF